MSEWIMVSGPYRSGSVDPEQWQRNLDEMNRVAFEVHKLGHIPVIGVNMAKPIIDAMGEAHYKTLMMPISMALAERCDAVLRIGGPSSGADQEVEYFTENGLPVYYSLSEIEAATS